MGYRYGAEAAQRKLTYIYIRTSHICGVEILMRDARGSKGSLRGVPCSVGESYDSSAGVSTLHG